MITKFSVKRGFTLIEVLLVITVLAIIASFAVSTVRRSAEHTLVAKVVTEMQGVQQAAMAYNVNNTGAWPAQQSDCASMPASIPVGLESFVDTYLPNSSGALVSGISKVKSSLGTPFCWSPGYDSASAADPNPKAPTFWVSVQIPGADTGLANLIKARMPNAVLTSTPMAKTDAELAACTTSSCYVRSEIPQPGPASNEQAGGNTVVGTGVCARGEGAGQPGSDDKVSCDDDGVVLQPPVAPSTQSFNARVYKIHVQCKTGLEPKVSVALRNIQALRYWFVTSSTSTTCIPKDIPFGHINTTQSCSGTGAESECTARTTMVAANYIPPYTPANIDLMIKVDHFPTKCPPATYPNPHADVNIAYVASCVLPASLSQSKQPKTYAW